MYIIFFGKHKENILNLTGGVCMHTRCSGKYSLHCKDDPRF